MVTTVAASPKISVTARIIFALRENPLFAIAARSILSLAGLNFFG